MRNLTNLFFVVVALLSVVVLMPFGILFKKNILKYRRPVNMGELWIQFLPFNGKENIPFLDMVYYGR